MNTILPLLLLLASTSLFAATQLNSDVNAEDNDSASRIAVTVDFDTGFPEANDLDAFVPFDSSGDATPNANRELMTIVSGKNIKNTFGADLLPDISPSLPNSIFNEIPVITVTMFNDDTTKTRMGVAVRDSTGKYTLIKFYATAANAFALNAATLNTEAKSQGQVTFVIRVEDICKVPGCFDAANYTTTSSPDQEHSAKLYFFPTNGTPTEGAEIKFGENDETTGGLFLTLNFSSKTDQDPTDFGVGVVSAPTIDDPVRTGDGQLTIDFDGINFSNNLKNTLIFFHSNPTLNPTILGNFAVPNGNGSFPPQILPPQQSGEIRIEGLTNDQLVHVSLGQVNKFQFSSLLSVSKQGIPREIETFLQEQSCYFFSAGFQTNHFVVDYFRKFRDRVLLSFPLGQAFVSLYYESAPKVAPYIYKSKVLSFITRMFAYTLYGFMRGFIWIALAAFGLFPLIIVSRRYLKSV